ncbi:preprotein translocase subunit SECE1-like [Papaver somniferum]|uniref:preprotein translocase subunit SECE1-like n=1 Tax=Papaver somniferum TaxID=3469 RepID=UPI000E6F5437|nr:preprotein translocase subunit SECE1-like [Papaver somniferum]
MAASSSSSLIHFPNLTTTRISHSSRSLSLQYKPQSSSSAAGASSLSYQSKITSRRNLKAIEKGKEENSATTKFENVEGGEELKKETIEVEDQLGAEIREAMKVKKEEEKENVNYWDGVIEEIKEIEWPVFSKVLGTTGVVIGVIAGSSVVLLTVNALLAEFSDQVFAGRGVQDFFG